MRIVLTGATGLIGRLLSQKLMQEGHTIMALARSPDQLPELPSENIFRWTDKDIPPLEVFKNCDAVIHLAGEGIADKLWTQERKKRLRESRVNGTRNIVSAIATLPQQDRPKLFISGSAIGIYNQSFEIQDESSILGSDFLAELCKDWEAEAVRAEDYGLRVLLLRTGLVLAQDGGLLSKSGPVILGSGQQWMSWVHIDDVVNFISHCLNQPKMVGPYNLTSPNPSTNSEFTKTWAQKKKIPLTVKAPGFLLKLAMGDLSQAVLSNQRVHPTRALESGFQFRFTQLEAALDDLMKPRPLTENSFTAKQFVPLKKSEVFSFFSKAENLETLTPPWLNFKIVDKSTPEIEKGTLINYKLKIHGIPVRWRTLIQEWNPDVSFVDFQLKGPYSRWHHLHTFEDVPGGTLISDHVTFKIPFGILGLLALPWVRHDVQQIFNYRKKRIKELQLSGQLK